MDDREEEALDRVIEEAMEAYLAACSEVLVAQRRKDEAEERFLAACRAKTEARGKEK
ncbi:MAG: hypothetical protein ABSA41_20855 [Terriglobia bacterium]|jgi:hypothetical protein